MNRIGVLLATLPLLMGMAASQAQAQSAATAPPAAAASAAAPQARRPDIGALGLGVARPVQAITAALGMGRQRLALVLGGGHIGTQAVLDAAPRDAQAIAMLLRASGYIVMVREDIGAAEWRSTLKEFRERLQPGGMGLIYVTALGLQIDGQNLLLARDAPLLAPGSPAEVKAALSKAGVPIDELVQALTGTAQSPRLLVVDAAYRHPQLARLAPGVAAGLAEQRLPPGMMALFAQGLGKDQDLPSVPALPTPAPTAASELAGSHFARTLAWSLATPRINGAEALRQAQRALLEGSKGEINPWLAGDTDSREEFAEVGLVESLLPRTPAETARETIRQGSNLVSRPGNVPAAGDMSVDEVLRQSSNASRLPAEAARAGASERPAGSTGTASPPTSLASGLGPAASALGTAASVAAAVAATAATVKVAEGVAVAQAATAAAGLVGSAATQAVSMAARVAGGASERPAQASAQALGNVALAPQVAPVLPVVAPNPALAAPSPVAPPSATATLAAPAAPAAPALSAVPAVPLATAAPGLADGRTQRAGDKGERPRYQPRSNKHGYTEGDSYTYRVTDTWKGEVTGSFTTAIDEVLSDGKLLANGAQTQMDAQGRITRQQFPDGSQSSFQPSQDLWWSSPKPGERREVLFKENFHRADRSRGETEWKGSTRVGTARQIDTLAGRFDVVPMESSGWFNQRMQSGATVSGQWQRTVWYSTKLGHPVAIDVQDSDRVGKLLKRERIELMHAQTARHTP